MAFATRQRGQPVLHTDNNQFANYFSGTREEAVTRLANTSASYADTLRQADITNGYIFRAGYGTSGSPTWMLDVTKNSVYAKNLSSKGPAIYDVAAYGALGDGSDQTTAINLAITDMLADTSFPGGILYFPPGDYAYNWDAGGGPLSQLQGKYGYVIKGAGMLASKLYPAVRSDKWNGKPFISLAGAHNCGIEDISIGIAATASQSFPACFLLLAQEPSNGSNALWLKNVRIEGSGKYGIYNFAVPSCYASNVHVYNRECTETTYADAGNVADGAAWCMTRDNILGIAGANSYSIMNTLSSGYASRSMSDWDITRAEIHDLTSLAGTANAAGLLLYQVSNIRIAGNISSNGTFIKIPAPPAAGGSATDNVRFNGTMYREDLGGGAGLTPSFAVLFSNLFSHGSPSLLARHIDLSGSRIDNKAADVTSSIFRAEAGWSLERMVLRNWTPAQSYTGTVVDITNNAGNVLLYPDIDCGGFGVSVGASGTITTSADGLTNPGTLTYSAYTSRPLISYADLITGAAPSNPSSGNRRLYSKTVSSQFQDGHPFLLTSGGTEREVHAGTLIAKVSRTSGSQALTTGGWRTLDWTVEDKDVDSGIALGTSASRINILSTGTYLVICTAEIETGAGNFRGLRILQSGTAVIALKQDPLIGGGYPSLVTVTGIYSTNATNTYLEAQAYQDSGGNLNFVGTNGGSFFAVIRLGPYI